jgi:hypothetical protein
MRRELHGSRPAQAFLLHIRLVNAGAQAVQIDTRRFESEGQSGEWGLSQDEFAGPGVPANLNGYSSIDWWIDIRSVSERLNTGNGRIRVNISLGSGKVVKSSWTAPASSENLGVQEELDQFFSLPIEPGEKPTVIW